MKKSKYFITFNGFDTLEVTTEISKKEHNRMRDELSLQVHKYEDSEAEPRIRVKEKDMGTYVERITWFNVSTSDIYLTELKCKPGYQFK